MAADVVFRAVSIEWVFGAVEHHQQLGLVVVEPRQQTVEGDEASCALEDAIEAFSQRNLLFLAVIAATGLESAIELPDELADAGLGRAVFVGEGVELVDQTFAMAPT